MLLKYNLFAKGQVTFSSFAHSQTLITPKFVVPRKRGSFLHRIITTTLNKHDDLFSAPVLLAYEGCTPQQWSESLKTSWAF